MRFDALGIPNKILSEMEAAPHYTLLTLLTVSKLLYTVDADDMVHTVDMVYTVDTD